MVDGGPVCVTDRPARTETRGRLLRSLEDGQSTDQLLDTGGPLGWISGFARAPAVPFGCASGNRRRISFPARAGGVSSTTASKDSKGETLGMTKSDRSFSGKRRWRSRRMTPLFSKTKSISCLLGGVLPVAQSDPFCHPGVSPLLSFDAVVEEDSAGSADARRDRSPPSDTVTPNPEILGRPFLWLQRALVDYRHDGLVY